MKMEEKLYDYMDWAEIEAVVYSEENHPRDILGPRVTEDGILIQAFFPGATRAAVHTIRDGKQTEMVCEDEAGFFAVLLPGKKIPSYTLIYWDGDGNQMEHYDPYAYPMQFTEQEQAELDKKLPYASSEAVIKLMQADKWLTYSTDMELVSSDLYKVSFTGKDKYYYTANFSSYVPDENDYVYEEIVEEDGSVSVPAVESAQNWQEVNITVDAESGQIMSYYFWDTRDSRSSSYDLDKADKLAEEIAKAYAGDRFVEYKGNPSTDYSWTDQNNKTFYNGSSHSWDRYSSDILVSGDSISVGLNADMKLTNYSYSYTDVKLPDSSRMLSTDMVMQKFWENNDLNLYYLARFTDKKTKTVLVYGTDSDVYVDATTGEPVYDWQYSSDAANDLSGIKDKKILKMAKALDDHGYLISTEKFSENDTADSAVFEQLMGVNTDEESKKLTRGDALVIFTKSVAGDAIPELKGIYKSPFSDVKDTDKNVGYYAIAYAMGAVSGNKLNAKADFTYGDMIKMVYTFYAAE